MTKQIRTGMGGRGFWQANSAGSFRYFTLLKIALLAVLAAVLFQVQSSAWAQGNLVDLYSWANNTGYVPDPNSYIQINSSTSAYFSSGTTTDALNGGPFIVEPILTGSLNTLPGVMYCVSFTMQLNAPFDIFGGASMSFGDFVTNCNLQNSANGSQPGYNLPVDFSFTSIALRPTTSMTFNAGFADYTDGLSISDVTVTEVPEIPTFCLLCYGGFLFLVAKQLRGLVQKRKLAFNR